MTLDLFLKDCLCFQADHGCPAGAIARDRNAFLVLPRGKLQFTSNVACDYLDHFTDCVCFQTADTIVSPEASAELYAQSTASDKTLKSYDGGKPTLKGGCLWLMGRF